MEDQDRSEVGMDAEAALSLLSAKRGDVPVRWWLAGPDTFSGGRVLLAMRAHLGPDTMREHVEGSQDPAELALRLQTAGFFQAPRLLIWRDPDPRSLKRASLADLARAAGPDAWLVIWVEKGEPPPDGAYAVVSLEYPRGAAWAAMVQQEIRRRGLALGRDAEAYLTEACRPRGEYLQQALDKLTLARRADLTLDLSRVTAMVAPLGEGALYLVTDALMRRDVDRAVAEVRRQRALGVAPAMVLAVMSRQMLLLDDWLRAASRLTVEQFLKARGLRTWQARLYRQAATLWTTPAVEAWLDWASRVDWFVKHSTGDPDVWLESLILLASPPRGRPAG
jgi:DNA polymerase III delta subunit